MKAIVRLFAWMIFFGLASLALASASLLVAAVLLVIGLFPFFALFASGELLRTGEIDRAPSGNPLPNGEPAEFISFRSVFFTIEFDFGRQKVEIRTHSRWRDRLLMRILGMTAPKVRGSRYFGSDDKRNNYDTGITQLQIPMDSFRFERSASKKHVSGTSYATTYGSGTGFVNGQLVTVNTTTNVPTGYYSFMQETDDSDFTFTHRQSPRLAEPKSGYHKRYEEADNYAVSQAYAPHEEIHLDAVSGMVSRNLAELLESESFKRQLDGVVKAADARLIDAAVQKYREAREAAARAQEESNAAMNLKLEEQVQAVFAAAGLTKGETRWLWQADRQQGKLKWLLAFKPGALLVHFNGRSWTGSAQGASASIRSEQGTFVEVELRDRDHEVRYMERLRFMIGPTNNAEAQKVKDFIEIAVESSVT